MLASQSTLTSPDGSSNRNPPERCPRPLYSRDSTREHQEIPQEDQSKISIAINLEVKEEMEDPYFLVDRLCKKEDVPPEICTDPGDTQRDVKAEEEEEGHVKIKVEEVTVEIGTDGQYRTFDAAEPPADPSGGKPDDNVTSDSPENEASASDSPKNDDITTDSSEGDDFTSDSSEGKPVTSNFHPAHYSAYTKSDPSKRDDDHLAFDTLDGPKQEKPYPCSECRKRYSTKQGLLIHQKTHTGEKPYSCTECGRCFAERSNLTKHRSTHVGEKPYSCSECGKRYYHKSSLLTHEKIHTGKKAYFCLECREAFSSQHAKHIHRRAHTGEKPHSCSECGKCFTTKWNLARHHGVHTGEKPNTCSDCGKCFSDRTHFNCHQKSHTREKPFSCPECGKSFVFKASLVKHKRNRTCVIHFSCPECGRDFRRKSSLVLHMEMHKRLHLMFQQNQKGEKLELKVNIKKEPS